MDYPLLLLILLGLAVLALLQTISQRLAGIQAQQQALLMHLGVTGNEPSEAVRELARDPQRRIEAIRLQRQLTGQGLKEAVEAIDKLAPPRA
jgi:ribosomal protein L7/L12